MPIYEYRCQKCSKYFEVIQKFSDTPLKKCPDCKGRLAKLISKASFQLKGTGWYVTDYARKSESRSKPEPSEAKSDMKNDQKKTDSSSESASPPSAKNK